MFRLAEEPGSKPLRHASRHAHDRAGLHVALQFTEAPDHALLRVLANGAGIHEDHVGAIGGGRRRVAGRRERAEHQLGVAHVHLATVGLDVDRAGRRGGHGRGGEVARQWRDGR